MKKYFTFLLIIATLAVNAQVTITGKLTDNKGKSIGGVSIALADSYDGSTTDSIGNYSFTTTELGEKSLSATMSGYAPYKSKIIIAQESIIQNISLKELITELNAVTITAGSFEASDKKKGSVLSSLDVVTTAGSQGDIAVCKKYYRGRTDCTKKEDVCFRIISDRIG